LRSVWQPERPRNADNRTTQLVAEHAKFHKAAAHIITKADSGATVIQDVALGAKSEFADVSQKVVSLLMECKKVCT
jgi:hypothetical protein